MLTSCAFHRLLDWLYGILSRTGLPVRQIARLQQANAMTENGSQRFMCHAGMSDGSKNLSSRRGLSRRWSIRRTRFAHLLHKAAPYKISSVRSAFARKLLAGRARRDAGNLV